MLRKAFFYTFLLLSSPLFADSQELLDELDAAITNRELYIQSKEQGIKLLKQKMFAEDDSVSLLRTLDDLYNEYYVFRFDSAMAVANQGLSLAMRQGSQEYIALFRIHLAEILALGGFYIEAVNTLESINPKGIPSKYLFKYYFTFFITYSHWSDYCHEQIFAQSYRQRSNESLQLAMQYANMDDPYYKYYKGEQNVYVNPDPRKARAYYKQVLNTVPENSRIYAMAAFALAGNCKVSGDLEGYEEYLIKAALSDLKSCTMETMALQKLALHLFQKDRQNVKRAELYIATSMEDAKFYNNRLRILENARILPPIMSMYQDKVQRQNRDLRYAVVAITILMLGLLLTLLRIFWQNRLLRRKRKQLADSYHQQEGMNLQLKELNQKLLKTNRHREDLVSLFIDLCAKYIDKLGKYQTLVTRKIKANQAHELLQTITSTRISKEDAETFLNLFDKDFLELYPTFVEEFNALFPEEDRIQLKSPITLTTELRIYALIRLGVKSTADIAGLLFLSTQTIYNCRSVIKSKALNKDSFDDDIQKLCMIIR